MKTIVTYLVIICCLGFFLIAFTGFYHAIHMSYGESKLSSNEFSGKITFNKPDFFKALEKLNGSPLSGFTNKQFDKIKLEYLTKHLCLKNTYGEILKLRLTGNSENENSIWFNFNLKIPDKTRKVEITNNSLMNIFSDQLNLLNIKSDNGERSEIFSESSPVKEIKLQD